MIPFVMLGLRTLQSSKTIWHDSMACTVDLILAYRSEGVRFKLTYKADLPPHY